MCGIKRMKAFEDVNKGGIRDSRFKSPFTIEGLSLCQLPRTLTCSRLTAWKSSISDGPNADCASISLPG